MKVQNIPRIASATTPNEWVAMTRPETDVPNKHHQNLWAIQESAIQSQYCSISLISSILFNITHIEILISH